MPFTPVVRPKKPRYVSPIRVERQLNGWLIYRGDDDRQSILANSEEEVLSQVRLELQNQLEEAIDA